MNLPFYLAKRIRNDSAGSFSRVIHRIAVASVSISLAIMILSFLILFGFQGSIREKIFSLASHLQVTKFTLGSNYDPFPISINRDFFQNSKDYPFVDHIQKYAYKTGLLKTDDEVLGVMLKGVSSDFDTARFALNMQAGRFVKFPEKSYSREVVLSRTIASLLQVDIGDELLIWFFQDPPRARKVSISGIYETGMQELDEKIILGDLRLIQRLNNWPDTLVGGYEVFVKDFNRLDQAHAELFESVDYDMAVEKVTDKYYQNFDWLNMLNKNVGILLGVIILVASFNMVSIVLILIMERTQMIGLLKACGARDSQIRQMFMYTGMRLIGKGLLYGNIIGLGLAFLQYHFRFIPLDPENYYMTFVPISWDWFTIIALNIGTFGVISLVLLIPTLIISRIQPIKSIRFD